MAYDHVIDPWGDVVFTLTPRKHPQEEPASASDSADEQSETQEHDSAASEDEPKNVTFLVSSRHLILASPMFKAALTGPWKEALVEGGLQSMDAEDWDVHAVTIVFDIIHGHWPSVPHNVDLDTLSSIAMVVDYYQLGSAMHLIAPLWIQRLQAANPISSQHSRNLVTWMFVAWVFRDFDLLQTTTDIATRTCKSDVTIHDLPLPSTITGLSDISSSN